MQIIRRLFRVAVVTIQNDFDYFHGIISQLFDFLLCYLQGFDSHLFLLLKNRWGELKFIFFDVVSESYEQMLTILEEMLISGSFFDVFQHCSQAVGFFFAFFILLHQWFGVIYELNGLLLQFLLQSIDLFPKLLDQFELFYHIQCLCDRLGLFSSG